MAVPLAMDFAVRLADEGVPLRAIARATRIPSTDLREQLREAKQDGRLVDLPKEDWPPGFPRDQRALQLSRIAGDNRSAIMLRIRQLFSFTPLEAQLFFALMQNDHVAKAGSDVMDVRICGMRKRLQGFAIKIITLWGYGYQLSIDDRRRALDLVLRESAA